MAGNTFGQLFRVTTAGVSHGPGYLAIIDGCPPGLPLSIDDLLPDLRRRRPGQSSIVSQRQEEDLPEIWSGVFEGKTDGTSGNAYTVEAVLTGVSQQDAYDVASRIDSTLMTNSVALTNFTGARCVYTTAANGTMYLYVNGR